MTIRVYVAGPIRQGDTIANIRGAIMAGEQLKRAGLVAYVPHLNCLWHLMYPDGSENWVDADLEWLALCHAVLRLPGPSEGADREVQEAKKLGIPVFEKMAFLLLWSSKQCPKP